VACEPRFWIDEVLTAYHVRIDAGHPPEEVVFKYVYDSGGGMAMKLAALISGRHPLDTFAGEWGLWVAKIPEGAENKTVRIERVRQAR
jgi:hypothetical protein